MQGFLKNGLHYDFKIGYISHKMAKSRCDTMNYAFLCPASLQFTSNSNYWLFWVISTKASSLFAKAYTWWSSLHGDIILADQGYLPYWGSHWNLEWYDRNLVCASVSITSFYYLLLRHLYLENACMKCLTVT